MCFCTQTYAKCRFWANFVPTCEYKTSRDLATDGPIFANLVSKDAQDLKEKSHEKACRDLRRVARQSRISCRGGQIDPPPPPPVKIGLSHLRKTREWRVLYCQGGIRTGNLRYGNTLCHDSSSVHAWGENIECMPPPPPPITKGQSYVCT